MVNRGCRQKRGQSHEHDPLYPIESLKTALLQCVVHAVEASADLLDNLQAEFETRQGRSQERTHADAVLEIWEIGGA